MASVELIARVECRSEGQAEERPVAVWLGPVRHEVVAVTADAVVGAARAGVPHHHRVTVELDGGRRLLLTRRLPDGRWRVNEVRRPVDSGKR